MLVSKTCPVKKNPPFWSQGDRLRSGRAYLWSQHPELSKTDSVQFSSFIVELAFFDNHYSANKSVQKVPKFWWPHHLYSSTHCSQLCRSRDGEEGRIPLMNSSRSSQTADSSSSETICRNLIWSEVVLFPDHSTTRWQRKAAETSFQLKWCLKNHRNQSAASTIQQEAAEKPKLPHWRKQPNMEKRLSDHRRPILHL